VKRLVFSTLFLYDVIILTCSRFDLRSRPPSLLVTNLLLCFLFSTSQRKWLDERQIVKWGPGGYGVRSVCEN
jgi:hypothetical protein